MFSYILSNILYVQGNSMAKIFTYVRVNKNNEKYTETQKETLDMYVEKHKMSIDRNIEIEINTPSDEKNILELLKNCEKNWPN